MTTVLTAQQLQQFVSSRGCRNQLGEDSHAAIEHLGRLLQDGATRKEAKTALLALAVFEDGHLYAPPYEEIPVEAWKQLKPVLGCPDVSAVFQRIATSDTRLPLRCRARNYLDNLQGLERTLRVEVVVRIISSLDVNDRFSAYVVNELLWTEKSVATEALSKIGSSAFAERVLTEFHSLRPSDKGESSVPVKNSEVFCGATVCGGLSVRFNSSAVYYSILRFVRIHSPDLSSTVKSRLAEIREITNKVYEKVLYDGKEADENLFHGVNQSDLDDAFLESEKREIISLINIISSESTPDDLKIVAIRYCGKYFFPQREYLWVQGRYKDHALRLYPHIVKLLEHSEKKVRDEAIFFTTLCEQHKKSKR